MNWFAVSVFITSKKKILQIRIWFSEEFVVPAEEADWVKFNVNQTGYYLVNYEIEEWDKLIQVLMTNHTVSIYMLVTKLF